MKLSQLLQDLPYPSYLSQLEISEITESSVNAHQNAIFVCITGATADGHRYAKNAYENGCRVFVAQKELSLPSDATVIRVSNTRVTLAQLANRFYSVPSKDMRVIGITGTKGKTTTAQMLVHILNRVNIPCGYIGTNGISYPGVSLPTKNTTPDAITLQKTLADMRGAGVKAVVLEVSSQALMQHRIDGTEFAGVLFTNLTPDHIGKNEHTDFEEYKNCKKRLFSDFDANCMICNVDDVNSHDMMAAACAKQKITCSMENKSSNWHTKNVQLLRTAHSLGVSFTLLNRGNAYPCVLPMTGTYNVNNALLAIAAATDLFAIPCQVATDALLDISVAGRSEFLPLPNGAYLIIDYAHNGESMRQLLSTLREYNPKKLTVVFGSIGERAQIRRPELGHVAAKMADLCILTSDNPANEAPEQIIDEIAVAFRDTVTPYYKIPDREEAIRFALDQAEAGEFVVLAGKGHETYQIIGNQKIPFFEKEIALDHLKAKK